MPHPSGTLCLCQWVQSFLFRSHYLFQSIYFQYKLLSLIWNKINSHPETNRTRQQSKLPSFVSRTINLKWWWDTVHCGEFSARLLLLPRKRVNILLQELLWRHEKLAHKILCFLRIIELMPFPYDSPVFIHCDALYHGLNSMSLVGELY